MRNARRQFASCEAALMAAKTGSELEELRALLAEVKALREDVELKAAELRGGWGVEADKSKAPPRVLNLSHYIALRAHDLTDLQYRLAARGLSSLGRSESHVVQALDALIATLKRLSGRTECALSVAAVSEGGRRGAGGGGGPAVRQAARERAPSAGDGDLAARGGDGTGIGRSLVAAGMDCARINCAHDDPEIWGQMVENVRRAASAARASLPGADGHRRPEVPHPESEGAAENAPLARRPGRSDRRTAREDQGADRVLAQFSRTRRPARGRLGNVHRRRQGGGASGLQVGGSGRD